MRDLLAALPTNDSKVEPQPYIMDDAFLLNAGTFAVDDDGYFVDEHGPDTDTNTDSSSLSVQSDSDWRVGSAVKLQSAPPAGSCASMWCPTPSRHPLFCLCRRSSMAIPNITLSTSQLCAPFRWLDTFYVLCASPPTFLKMAWNISCHFKSIFHFHLFNV